MADQGPQGGEPRQPRVFRKRLIRVIQVLAGTITLAATIIATVITVNDRAKPYTMEEWRRKANATCEQDFGTLHTPVLSVVPLLAQAIASTPPSGTGDQNLTQVAKTVGETAFAFRKLSGDLRLLDLPEDHDQARIDRLLSAAGEVSVALTAVATFVVNYQIGKATLVDGQNAMTGLQNVMTTSLPAWSATAGELGLDQCQAIVGNTAPAATTIPTPVSSPSTAALTARQQALEERLKPDVLVRCTANPSEENENVVAAVSCDAAKPGPTRRPLVIQFASTSRMDEWINRVGTGTSRSECANGGYRNNWHHDNVNIGTLVCNTVPGGLQIVWTFPDDDIVVLIDASDPQTGYLWWTENAFLLTTG